MNIFSHTNFSKIIRILPALIIMMFIFKIFIFSDTGNWQKKYNQFSVPANSYPGGDSRNIQLSAYCKVKHNHTKIYKDCFAISAKLIVIAIDNLINKKFLKVKYSNSYNSFPNNDDWKLFRKNKGKFI